MRKIIYTVFPTPFGEDPGTPEKLVNNQVSINDLEDLIKTVFNHRGVWRDIALEGNKDGTPAEILYPELNPNTSNLGYFGYEHIADDYLYECLDAQEVADEIEAGNNIDPYEEVVDHNNYVGTQDDYDSACDGLVEDITVLNELYSSREEWKKFVITL